MEMNSKKRPMDGVDKGLDEDGVSAMNMEANPVPSGVNEHPLSSTTGTSSCSKKLRTICMNDTALEKIATTTTTTTTDTTSVFDYYDNFEKDTGPIWEHLREHGWAVISRVLTPEKVDTYFGEMWQWFESLGTGIDRTNPNTWKGEAWPFNIHGILQHYRCGHSNFVWNIRTEHNVVGSFAKLWNVPQDELLTSFDGFCFMKGPANSKPWAHWDQGSSKQGLQALQGLVTLSSVETSADGGLVVWDRSHAIHEDYWNEYNTKSQGDWYKIPEDNLRQLERDYRIKKVLVKAPAGSLVLWDSRVIHHNQPPKEGNTKQRACVYVCMTPRQRATPKDIKKKQDAFNSIRMTTHWPHTVKLFPENPRHYGKPQALQKFRLIDSPPVLSSLGMRLAGFS